MHIVEQFLAYGKTIKFSHTIFALPFALSAIVLAYRHHSITLMHLFWILIAMVGARSSAMGFNRIADAGFDAKNPRTSKRAIPSGRLSLTSAKIFVILFSAVFIFAAAMLGKACLYLSFPVLALLFSYSYTKRFTWFSHFYLGFVISLAPLGAWIAITNTFSLPVLFLSLALLTYISGFDILYACQDTGFDTKEGLFSIPARLGIQKALLISSISHVFSFLFLFLIFIAFDMKIIYLITILIIGLLLIIEHKLVKPSDLSNVNIAFFHVNSAISIILFVGILADELFRYWI
ncbi:MAG: UbiA-like polyprenyltransferase [Thermodesulfobacteriota bacterium]|nr:UbiA-like polyprenyltransferase [Thermodesulfobacteriota bacterium]